MLMSPQRSSALALSDTFAYPDYPPTSLISLDPCIDDRLSITVQRSGIRKCDQGGRRETDAMYTTRNGDDVRAH